MADRTAYRTFKFAGTPQQQFQNLPVFLVDMKDGTYAERTVIGPLPMVPTDHSGTGTGSSQVVLQANPDRRFLFVQNPSTQDTSFWIDLVHDPAVRNSPSMEVAPGVSLVWDIGPIPTSKLCVNAPSGIKYTILEG